jgi:hypothetical protein
MRYQQLFENNEFDDIGRIFRAITTKFDPSFDLKIDRRDTFMTVYFLKNGLSENTITLQLPGDGTLHIWDTYVPESLRGKGYLTTLLSKIRELPFLNGKARVHVAMNDAWPKIIQRAGFTKL